MEKACNACGKQNHFADVCKGGAARNYNKRNRGRGIHLLESQCSSEEELTSVTFDTVESVNAVTKTIPPKKLYAAMEIAGKQIQMQIDTGASCNVLPEKYVPPGTPIKETERSLKMYSKSTMAVVGTCKVSMCNPKNQKKYRGEFVVVQGDYTPLLGSRAAQQMNLLTVRHENILQVCSSPAIPSGCPNLSQEQIMSEFGDVFKGQGHMKGKLHLEVDESVTPVIMPLQREPFALKEKLKDELNRLEDLNMIRKVEEPTQWVSSLVVVQEPNGKLRVCIDPAHLNKALKRSHYPLPVIDDILPELAEVQVFSKADLKDGFLHIELDEQSSILTTFQTPWGRYCWRRMPFGISPAPEYF